ncbi:MAG: hydantoinase/oxoprolinase family protein [Chromatiales bacterium]|jgi:N-methylhydantoinase A|nr:hydantoinase/oxoprolinase family protein [Chromatiales bacterium]
MAMPDIPISSPSLRVAFDIGGTFTDVLIAGPHGRLLKYKILTLPDSIGGDVNRCIESALAECPGSLVSTIVHGTTVAANAVLEQKGAKTGLLTTQGFRDELEIRRLGRPGIYSVFWERNAPLIPRRLRLEVNERLRMDGAVDAPLDEAAVEAAAYRFREAGIEALAIAFLHAYVNPVHEERARVLVRAVMPEIDISTSAEVLPEVREYERTSTTALNAYLTPVVNRYLGALEEALSHHGTDLRIMQSNGGIMSAARTRARPVNMIESGPAAGVLAAAELAGTLNLQRVVSFDMGGTTAKGCLIEHGKPVETSEGEVGAGINIASRLNKGAGYALRVPAYDIAEVGAGGGSIAWVDEGGALRVGPHSAGAEPGPAAYGRGGVLPTITDANVLLGFMNPTAIAGGTVPIDVEAARVAFEPIAKQLSLSLNAAAYGVHQVGNATMARAIRAVTTERGRDPRDYDLVAFGGAGAIHALTLADSLGIKRALVPLHPGLFSAVGLLLADHRYDFVQSVSMSHDASNAQSLLQAYSELSERAYREAGFSTGGEAVLERFVDLRYARQSSDLTLPLPDVDEAELPQHIASEFHREHERNYGYCQEADEVMVVSIRVRLTAPAKSVAFPELAEGFWQEAPVQRKSAARDAYFGGAMGLCYTPVVTRRDLAEQAMAGPLIVEEFDTTVVVPPLWQAKLDDLGNIQLRRD